MSAVSADSDDEQGYFTGTFSFGPNRIGDEIDETHVTGYKVLIVDTAGSTLSTVSTVAKNGVATSGCGCNANEYPVSLNRVQLPDGAAGVMVVATDSNGMDMPAGHFQALVDAYPTTTSVATTAGPAGRAQDSSARRSWGAALSGASAALLAARALLSL